eukprot:GFYU01014331.1.p1 GENE.GFYU01014331.1~~GFYU01014331.1.p1  ORF type:complete len:217 (+),score=21.79 GFYU01014331.1:98-652(+)
MGLSGKQLSVAACMLPGLCFCAASIVYSIQNNSYAIATDASLHDRLSLACQSFVLMAATLALSVGRLAGHRFFSPEDIDGGGLSAGTSKAKVLQSIIQNTLEQVVLAVVVHVSWAVSMPASWLSALPLAGRLFVTGRILFAVMYPFGAGARAMGFVLTFYPSVVMLVLMTLKLHSEVLVGVLPN